MDALRLKRLAKLACKDFKLADTLLCCGECFLESHDFLFRSEIERAKVHMNFLPVAGVCGEPSIGEDPAGGNSLPGGIQVRTKRMPDYQNMNAIEAVRHAKAVSGMTVEQIARAADMPVSTIRRYMERDSGYSPSLERIPALCEAMGNVVLVQWIEAQLDVPKAPAARSRADVLTAMARAAASMGDVQRRLAESEAHGIDPACARDVRSLLGDVIAECRHAQASLAEQASYRDMTEVAPLASVRRRAMPWWRRLWKW